MDYTKVPGNRSPQSNSTSRGRATACTVLAVLAVVVFLYRALIYEGTTPEVESPLTHKNVSRYLYP